MKFNIYLDTKIGAALKRLAQRRNLTRNALFRKAVEDLLEKETRSQQWSEAVLQWQGDPKFTPFESLRAKLADPAQETLGLPGGKGWVLTAFSPALSPNRVGQMPRECSLIQAASSSSVCFPAATD